MMRKYLTRRSALATLIGLAGFRCLTSTWARAAYSRRSQGCCITADEFNVFVGQQDPKASYLSDDSPIEKSGNPAFDFALAHGLARISKLFSVVPGFAYYDDSDSKNAFASPEVRMDKADGTVLFGQNLLKDQLAVDDGDVYVLAICAHEFGHVVQFKKDLIAKLNKGQSDVKRSELHADFLAGYFAAHRKHEDSDFPAVKFAVVAHQLGDFQRSQQHHGTPNERAAAISEGFKTFKEDGLAFDEAVDMGVQYVLSI